MLKSVSYFIASTLLAVTLATPATAGSLDAIVSPGGKVVHAKMLSGKDLVSPDGFFNTAGPRRAPAPITAADLAFMKGTTALGAESIIGTDERVQVTATTSTPFKAIALMTFTQGSSSARCTAWFISANTLITAGHCVNSGGNGSTAGTWTTPSSVKVYPGYKGTGNGPFGFCTVSGNKIFSVNGWVTGGRDDYDYGALKVKCPSTVSGYHLGYFSASSLSGLPTTVTGYPGDKPFTMWRSTKSVSATDSRRVFYKNDTAGGQSGAPVYYNRSGCGNCAMAVHAYGTYGSGLTASNNHGTRINASVASNFAYWKSVAP